MVFSIKVGGEQEMNSKLVRFVLAAVCMGIVLPSTTLWAQSKVAFFDPQQILGKFKPFQEAQREYGRYEEELLLHGGRGELHSVHHEGST